MPHWLASPGAKRDLVTILSEGAKLLLSLRGGFRLAPVQN
jgi:hypothetical protein